MWLHYLVKKMLEKKRYSKAAKINAKKLKILKDLEPRILEFRSCYELLDNNVLKPLLMDLGFGADKFESDEE